MLINMAKYSHGRFLKYIYRRSFESLLRIGHLSLGVN